MLDELDGLLEVRFMGKPAGRKGGQKAADRIRGKTRTAPHPTTGDMDYNKEELEFMAHIEAFKARTGRKFPTWSEVLREVKEMGYVRSL